MAWSKVSSKTKNGKKREPFSELVVRTVSKRIDLTQFEGIGKWEVEKRLDGGYAIKTGRDNFSLEEAETIAKLPSLIAELKICYEAIDVLSSSAIEDAKTSMKLAQKLAKQNRDIEEIIDCLDGVDSIFGEEIIGMLRPLLTRF